MRARFTIAEIQRCALEIVDRDGLPGLSMRTLATALGTGPMTLYNYVADRAAIEELIVDAVASSVRLPTSTCDWRRDVTAVATATWKAMRAHPAAIPLMLTRRSVSGAGFAPAEALIAALTLAELDDYHLLAAFRAVLGFIMGSAQLELAGPLPGAGRRAAEARAVAARIGAVADADYPHIARLSHVSIRSSAGADFARGLVVILDGIQAQL